MKKTKLFALVFAVVMAFNAFAVTACSRSRVSEIEITTPPTKTAYKSGEKFDKSGMVVTAKYSDGKSAEVTEYQIDKTDALTTFDTAVTVTYQKKTAAVNISVTPSNSNTPKIDLTPSELNADNEKAIKDFTDELLDKIIDNKENWSNGSKAALDGLGDKFVKAFENAGITDSEFDKLEEFVDELQKAMSELAGYDTSCGEFCACGCHEGDDCDCDYGPDMDLVTDAVLGLLGKFNETGISNQKIARLTWEIAAALREPVETFLKDPASGVSQGADFSAFFSCYDDFLAVGQINFILAVQAVLDLAQLAACFDYTVFQTKPTENEFRDIIHSIKADAVKALNILGKEQIAALASFTKVFVPLLSKVIISDIESEIEICTKCIADCKTELNDFKGYLADAVTAGNGYLIDYYSDRVYWLENDIAYYEKRLANLKAAGSEAQLTAKFSELVDAFAGDYGKLANSIRATLDAIDDTMLETIYGFFDGGDIDPNKLAIIFGKLINAGFTVENGLNMDCAPALIEKYFGFIVDIMGLTGEDSEWVDGVNYTKGVIFDYLEQVLADAAALAAKDYRDTLGKSFEENLIVIYVNSRMAPR